MRFQRLRSIASGVDVFRVCPRSTDSELTERYTRMDELIAQEDGMVQTYNCRNCGEGLTQTWMTWCPHCGIARPGGKARHEELMRLRYEMQKNGLKAYSNRVACHLLGISLLLSFIVGCIFRPPISQFFLWWFICTFILVIVIVKSYIRQIATINLRYVNRRIAEFEKIDPKILPEESLLRASSTPTSPATLLRPAQGTNTSAPEELLRAEFGGDAKRD
jgi:hypothetical protein